MKLSVADNQTRERARKIAESNIELEAALSLAQKNEAKANTARHQAEQTAIAARKALQDAVAARDEAEKQRREAERLRDLAQQRAELAEKARRASQGP